MIPDLVDAFLDEIVQSKQPVRLNASFNHQQLGNYQVVDLFPTRHEPITITVSLFNSLCG